MQKVVAIDVGFGDVKVAYREGGELIMRKFPSAVKEILSVNFEFNHLSQEKKFLYHSKHYVLGEAAKLDGININNIEKLMFFTLLLIYKVFHDYSIPMDNILLALGLPLQFYNQTNVQKLKASVADFEVDNESLGFNSKIFPQGASVYFTCKLLYDTPIANTLILDVGFNTVECIWFQNSKHVPHLQKMLERDGIMKIAQLLKGAVKYNISPLEAVDILRTNKIKIYNEEEDLSNIVDEHSATNFV
ncbi:conserved hypothetical protein [Deferribacter desulfuricans SSM1]|uniref:Actin-like protein N-terminal domain-containing protein n=1 Tax=Deferribacter desulfuricans (strain DSM 14783 / JCM 11476 / NBRC 101012 / SSM1) TaxID=639282 RepID=D3PCM7_DEFDS|nr:hypothetical protein [Deferribacter desulfuricans]BAI80350.1 conserved hypothetical protein [Deferribacter desulfuricans SSM1]